MVEMKEFKSVAIQVCQDVLIPSGRIPATLLTKALLETASGAKLWQTLRSLSDYALLDHLLSRYHKSEVKDLPLFV
jgi:predicted lipid carrier protein YhbT